MGGFYLHKWANGGIVAAGGRGDFGVCFMAFKSKKSDVFIQNFCCSQIFRKVNKYFLNFTRKLFLH